MIMVMRLAEPIRMNAGNPMTTISRTTGQLGRRLRTARCNVLFPDRKYLVTYKAVTACEMTVAIAAPRTPMSNAKMNIGSSAMFRTAPRTMFVIAMRTFPSARARSLTAMGYIAKAAPRRITRTYSSA